MPPFTNPSSIGRHYSLDWLRIIAFGLLILYHTGMFYVPWDWHVKSAYANEGPELAMALLNPWRLALLFFISGVAARFLADKLGAAGFAGERVVRILPVILFGMAVIVMPQTWFELRQAGIVEADAFFAFYGEYLQPGTSLGLITPTWNHLWYVVYLLVYCLLIAPLLPVLRWLGDGPAGRALGALWDSRAGPIALIALIPLPFIAYRIFLDPHFETTHNLVEDWANHAHRLTIFLIGFWAAKSGRFWAVCDRALPFALIWSVGYAAAFAWALGRPDGFFENRDVLLWTLRVARIVYAWAVIVALIGLARRFLNGDGPVRRYLTEAIFPFYILHQTLIVAIGYYLTQLGLGVWTEFALVLALTVSACLVGFEIIRRIGVLRPLFGLKPRSGTRPTAPQAAE